MLRSVFLQLFQDYQVSFRQVRVRVHEVVEELFCLLGCRWVFELKLSVLLSDVFRSVLGYVGCL